MIRKGSLHISLLKMRQNAFFKQKISFFWGGDYPSPDWGLETRTHQEMR